MILKINSYCFPQQYWFVFEKKMDTVSCAVGTVCLHVKVNFVFRGAKTRPRWETFFFLLLS
jgi:hypothetical protein